MVRPNGLVKPLQGTEEISQYLTDWLLAHDFDAVAEFGSDFQCDTSSNTIYWTMVVPNDLDEMFIDICRECEPDIVKADTFLLSFFHELGHIETEDYWTDKEWNKYYKFVETPDDHTVEQYFHHPIEIAATAWGCKYIVEHTEIVKDFIAGYVPLIKRFYELNEVELG